MDCVVFFPPDQKINRISVNVTLNQGFFHLLEAWGSDSPCLTVPPSGKEHVCNPLPKGWKENSKKTFSIFFDHLTGTKPSARCYEECKNGFHTVPLLKRLKSLQDLAGTAPWPSRWHEIRWHEIPCHGEEGRAFPEGARMSTRWAPAKSQESHQVIQNQRHLFFHKNPAGYASLGLYI